MATYSISVRLQRTTVEEAYVSVPVGDAVLRDEPEPDGSARLDPQKVMAAAVELGRAAHWSAEDVRITPHPIQKPPPGVEEG
ncbi:hypothetical protein AB0878_43340 [Amycolatopsis sp. NPDC047767]|uniref:hypothetical protein n=1 Tax=Amycolatopsis sp. NPDC047767 TaxID=3156765 RepID=UPI00345370C3